MTNPQPPIADEMLSAYLDDELNPDDKASVTAAIENDPRLRALVDDLRRIRADIRALPTHSLSPAFAQRVSESLQGQANDTVAVKPYLKSFHKLRWLVGCAATAAMIMIALWAVGPGGIDNSSDPRMVAANSGPESESDSVAAVESESSEDVDTDALVIDRKVVSADEPRPLSEMAAPSAEALVQEPLEREALNLGVEVRPFEWSTQKDSIDAVLAVTVPSSRRAALQAKGNAEGNAVRREWPRFGQSRAHEEGQEEASENNLYAYYYRAQGLEGDFNQFGIDESSNVILLEGTSQQIADGMKSLEITPTNTLLLKRDELAMAAGLPLVESVAGQNLGRTEVLEKADGLADRQPAELSLPAPTSAKSTLAQSAEELAEAASAPTPLRRARSTQPPAAQSRDQQESPRRYRVLLIVNP